MSVDGVCRCRRCCGYIRMKRSEGRSAMLAEAAFAECPRCLLRAIKDGGQRDGPVVVF